MTRYCSYHKSYINVALATLAIIFTSLIDAKEQLDPPNGLNQTITGLTTMEMLQSSLVQKITRSQMDSTTTSSVANDRDRQTDGVSMSSVVHYTTMKPLIVPTLPEFRHKIVHSRPYQSNKHYHDQHWGPFFEEPLNVTSGALQVGFHLGTEAILHCRVGMLKDKTVMWVRRTVDKVSLLTVGNVTYSGDPRLHVTFQYPNNWRLHINPIKGDDAGLYMCQVSTHPPRVFATNLTVMAPAIRVVDELGHEVLDRYYKLGSHIDLTCQVANTYLATLPNIQLIDSKYSHWPSPELNEVKPATTNFTVPVQMPATPAPQQTLENKKINYYHHKIYWKKDGEEVPHDVRVTLSTSKYWRNSRLTILQADRIHSGAYLCSIVNISALIAHVQILNGETPAAVQHNAASLGATEWILFLKILLAKFMLISTYLYN